MADIEFNEFDTGPAQETGAGQLQGVINWAGALTSVALVVGLGLWGYKLTVRDVTGVPVVRALEGPMRVAPEDPGGRPAEHQGLSVNSVAAEGEAAAPADRLVLAPRPQPLAAEDKAGAAVAEANTPAPMTDIPTATDDAVALALAMAQEVTAGATPIEPAAPIAAPTPVSVAVAPSTPAAPAVVTPKPTGPKIIPASVPGVSRSLRPLARPATRPVAAAPADNPITQEAEVDAASIPVGTSLVQLGAFDSAEVARTEWQRLSGKFGSLLEGKQRLVQSAKSGGRTFYRLRAVGFADLSDARRFCAALTAEKADCIPVVAR